jgi:uncharacterized protein YecT (DUF1311 family)
MLAKNLTILLCASSIAVLAQATQPLSPEQTAKASANAAFAAEAARENAGDCPNAATTLAINRCLDRETAITDANYKAFATSLRAMLAALPSDAPPAQGPTGPEATAQTATAAFDAAEAAWQTYRNAECNAVGVQWRGGTIVNSMVGYCWLRVTRSRMHELNDAYEPSSHR